MTTDQSVSGTGLWHISHMASQISTRDKHTAALRQQLYREIVAARKEGTPAWQVARAAGVSRERVYQIVEKMEGGKTQ